MSVPQPAPASRAAVATDRPARYGKQLVGHMSRRVPGQWDEDTRSGVLEFGASRVDLSCSNDALLLALTAPAADVPQLEDVLGKHLVRFGARDELLVQWVRADGSAGTAQRKDTDD